MTFKDELDTHIRARYPVLFLASFEEARVERLLREVAEARQKKVVVWSATRGFVNGDKTDSGAADLPEAFDQIGTAAKAGEKAIYLFKDLPRFMGPTDNVTYRLLRDAAADLRGSFCTIVILAPELKIPKELEKCVTVLDVPYPTREELQTVMDRVVQAARTQNEAIAPPDEETVNVILRSAAGLTEEEFENICAKSLIRHKRIDPALVVEEKEATIRKSGIAEFYQTVGGLEQVGGLEPLKEWITRRAKTFSQEALKFGVKPPRGIFLSGVTGCGKSLSVKAMAHHLKMPLLAVDPARVLGQFVGQSEGNLRQLFKLARAVSPVVLWFDEAEKLLPQGTAGDSGVSSRLFGMLLTEMQEVPATQPVLFAFTCNDPLKLPVETFTRMDAVFFVDLPDQTERESIWKVLMGKVGRELDIEHAKMLASASEGWTGREMEFILNEALTRTFEEGTQLQVASILLVLKERQPMSVQRKADIEAMRSWGREKALLANRRVVSVKTNGRALEL